MNTCLNLRSVFWTGALVVTLLNLRLLRWSGLLLIALAAGCASTAPQRPSPLADAVPASFKAHSVTPIAATHALRSTTAAPTLGATARPSAPASPGTWWTVYADPVLNALVERANQGNTDIHIAASRLAHAQALATQAGATRQPQLGLAAGVTRLEGPLLNAAGQEGTLLTAGATLSYEVDVLGRLSKAGAAATLDQQGRAALLDSARLLTQTQVVQTYLALRSLDAEAELLRQSLEADHHSLTIQAWRLQAGSLSEVEFERLRSDSAAAGAQTQVLQQRRAELENSLAVLLGEAPSAFALTPADWTGALPVVPTGLPAQVLARRPDIAAAQKNLLAAQQRLGIAQTAWFPSLVLTGNSGFASSDLSTLFSTAMQTWALGAVATVPLLDGGRRDAAVAMADADLQTAAASYRSQVLLALREVEDQLSATRLLTQQSDAMQRAWVSTARATELSAMRLRNGSISQLEWLEAQRRELHSRRQLLQAQAAQYQTSVALVRALGGGWE
jgi:multidrug efflux system outer membrane protein